ncbi:MAG TPA: hypothetical protein VGT79_07320, partial [Xanthomonadaceae bacterium]|nr:hypothetical protein [Xanthomonadaceae bacterium]
MFRSAMFPSSGRRQQSHAGSAEVILDNLALDQWSPRETHAWSGFGKMARSGFARTVAPRARDAAMDKAESIAFDFID